MNQFRTMLLAVALVGVPLTFTSCSTESSPDSTPSENVDAADMVSVSLKLPAMT